MNCKKAEQHIILYSELSIAEKTQVDIHLENCVACQRMFTTLQQRQSIFNNIQSWNAAIKDPVAFTDQIMEALPKKSVQAEKKRNTFSALFNWTPLQTGLVACSLILFFTFGGEFSRHAPNPQLQPPIKNGIVLSINLQDLIQAKRERAARISLADIIRKNQSLALSKK